MRACLTVLRACSQLIICIDWLQLGPYKMPMLQLPVRMQKFFEPPPPGTIREYQAYAEANGLRWQCLNGHQPPISDYHAAVLHLRRAGGKWRCLERPSCPPSATRKKPARKFRA